MSDTGGGASVGLIAGAGIGVSAIIVAVIAVIIYCYMKARKKNSNTNMTKSNDVFATGVDMNYPKRSRVNQYPDPAAARKAREREKARDKGHVNAAYSRQGSDSSSMSSDVEGRDFSPPRVHRPRGGQTNRAYSSDSSYDDSSSLDEDPVVGGNYRMERETGDRPTRSSYKRSKQNDILDGGRSKENGVFRRNDEDSRRRSRRDEFNKRNPRSDSPLTVATLKTHEKITQQEDDGSKWDSVSSRKDRSRRPRLDRDSSPSRTIDSSEVTGTSLVTEATGTTASSRFTKNPSLRRNSPSRSSSHRRYRKDNEKDSHGRRKPRRTRSSERDRSRSPGSQSSRSGSGSSRRSRASSHREAKKTNKEQELLPIFADPKKKKSSAV